MAAPESQLGLQRFDSLPRSTFSRQEYESYKKQQSQHPEILALIEKFYHQLRYGCTATTCDTKTCRTRRSQLKGAPYRVPTPTTARTLAAFMASLDNPYRCLCPHTPAPKASPFDTAFPTSKGLYSLTETPDERLDEVLFEAKKHAVASGSSDWFAKAEMEEWLVIQALSNDPVDLQSPKPYTLDHKIDTKSFMQKMFNTSRWRLRLALEDQSTNQNTLSGRQLTDDDSGLSAKVVFEITKTAVNSFEVNSTQTESKLSSELPVETSFQKIFMDPLSLHNQSLLEGWVDDLTVATDIANLRKVLSSPSKLITYGLEPILESQTTLGSRQLDMNSTFLYFRSQPLIVMFLEFAFLKYLPNLEPGQHLQWLASPVKSAYLKPDSTDNMPGPAAAHIVAIAISALLAFARGRIKDAESSPWEIFEKSRQKGRLECTMVVDHDNSHSQSLNTLLVEWTLGYEDPEAQSLMRLVLRTFASWSYAFSHSDDLDQQSAVNNTSNDTTIQRGSWSNFGNQLLDCLCRSPKPRHLGPSLFWALIEWARTIFLREWKGEAQFHWNTDIGAAVEFMSWLYDHRVKLGVPSQHFTIDALVMRMDYVEACRDWLSFKTNSLTGHLLSLPWILSTSAKFTMFRSISLCRMVTAHESAETLSNVIVRMSSYVNASQRRLFYKLSKHTETFLILEIRRDNILEDCFNQLWRRQKKELLRPLKVRMGMDEGEEGVDMGGVQQEFFRLVIAEALDPQYGLFTADPTTRMTWFQPMSPAPLHQFTLIGLIFGLALYNGITLTVTFPLAFYRKLLGIEDTELEHIKDGWPELHKGMSSLLTWSDGKVEDVFVRLYRFEFESLGTVHSFDMQKVSRIESKSGTDSISTESTLDESLAAVADTGTEDTPMVTNDNRAQFVKDYVSWLTNKSIATQFDAFKAGFHLPLHKKALTLLSPRDLQTLIEGHHSIDIDGLRKAALYEDKYNANHPKIKEFWEVVEDMTDDQHKKLLEFVTASPRVPARGISEIEFTIQRNGVGDERLPTSTTCFGRLLLPEYSSKEIMKEKLMLAIENSIGFGTQ